MEEALMEAITTSTAIYSDRGETVSEVTSGYDSEETGSDYYASSLDGSPYPSPAHVMVRPEPQHTVRSYDRETRRTRGSRFVMNDRDKGIYNSLGSSSSAAGKVTINYFKKLMIRSHLELRAACQRKTQNNLIRDAL